MNTRRIAAIVAWLAAPCLAFQPQSAPAHVDRDAGVRRFGGNRATEDAVDAGLAWLAAHQDDDGTWDRFAYQKHCPSETSCSGKALTRTEPSLDAGLTGLCLLAFLGAGNTDADGPHAAVVARAVDALLRTHDGDGGFAPDAGMAGYNTSLAGLSLAEYLALTRNARVRPAVEAAVARLARTQQAHGGWDYVPRSDSGRNDTSISAWAVQALIAADAAGVEVPRPTLVRAALHFSRATNSDGRVWYADAGTGFGVSDQGREPSYRFGGAMTAAGLACGQWLGWRRDGETIARQRALLLADLPSVGMMQQRDKTQLHDYYYWYYGTMGLFQVGDAAWDRWNSALRDALLPLQSREKSGERPKHNFGSWPAYGQNWGKWGRMGSRVYVTALCVLTLEIYYRHPPAYLVEGLALTAPDWREHLKFADAKKKLAAVRVLAEMRLEIGEPVLRDLLADNAADVRVAAARALTELDSPLGLAVLEAALDSAVSIEKERVARAIATCKSILARPPASGSVRVYDAPRGLATLSLDGAYAGLRVSVRRDGWVLARGEVIQRFSEKAVCVAQLTPEDGGEAPKPDDRVIAGP
jgi:Squalene-hopene cyclase C-terminal domain/Family of unknown function (DUF6288)